MRSVLNKAPKASVGTTTQPSNEVIRAWKAFADGGLTSQFLTDLLRLKDKSVQFREMAINSSSASEKSLKIPSFKRRPCSDFQSIVELGLRGLVEDSNEIDIKEKILVSCLTAIKGVYFKSQAKTAVEDLILASSKVVNASHSLTDKQKSTLTVAMTSLLTNREPLSCLERILQCDSFQLVGGHDETTPVPFGNISSDVTTGKKGGCRSISPSFVEPSSSSNMKLVSLLTFKSYELFPFLMKLKIDDTVWQRYIQDLIDADHRFAVLKAIQLNPDRIGLAEIRWLERALKENNDWESFAELLGYIFHVRRAVADRLHFQALPKSHTDQSSGGKRSAAGLTNAENIKNSNLVKRVADSVIWRDGCEGSNALMPKCDGHCSLLTLTEPLFLSIMETFLAECIAVDSTLSLRAASIIVSDFTGYCSLNEERIKMLQTSRKLKQFVTKDKWLLAAQTAHSHASKETLYRILQECGKYVEAKSFYEQFGLAAYFPPVDDAKIEEQKLSISRNYLTFPNHLTKIVFVDSLEAILFMAKIFGVSATDELLETDSNKQSNTLSINSLTIEDVIDASKQSLLHFEPVMGYKAYHRAIDDPMSSECISVLPSNPDGFRNVVGVDAEWKVEMYVNNSNEGAGILQLASPGYAFVIDLYKIGAVAKDNEMQCHILRTAVVVIRNIFSDKKLLKLAFDFYLEDMKMIKNAGKGAFENAICKIESLLDIQAALRSKVAWFDLDSPMQRNSKNAASLSEACKRYLGKPLLKSSQISDWKQRPLTELQLHYASLDAHCLIGILDALLLERGIDCGLQVAVPQYGIVDWMAQNSGAASALQRGLIPRCDVAKDEDVNTS